MLLIRIEGQHFLLYFLYLFVIFVNGFEYRYTSSSSTAIQETTVRDLIRRKLPDRASEFQINVNSNWFVNGKDSFKIRKLKNGYIQINGSSGVAAAWGFYHYLRRYCDCQISWECDQLNVPEIWPSVEIKVVANDRFRYYQNVCTASYSFVWWQWNDWEKHLDWIAMNAFNLVLAPIGQEAIWLRVYEKLNLSHDDINNHFTGPAFLSWFRMGNLRQWAGNLTTNWHANSLVLQKRILQRMRDFGITPVLPAFAGHVPRAFKRIFPNSTLIQINRWSKFNDQYCCPYLVNPSDPLFIKIGRMFLTEMITEFGTDNYYSCDTFNEMVPNSGDEQFLRNVSRAIFKSMTFVDPKAIWLLQNWLFIYDAIFWTSSRVRAFVTSVPKGKMIILDLQSEQLPLFRFFDSYYGQPFIWCMLHNFGGTLGMLGSSTIINNDVLKGRQNSTMIGIGLTMEGINQNYVIYELMLENSWIKKPLNLTVWFAKYSIRRYNRKNRNVTQAWQSLQKSVYDYKDLIRLRGKYVVNRNPSLKIKPWFWYDTSDVIEAWNQFVNVSDMFNNSKCFKHDLVDLTRQVFQISIDKMYRRLIKSFKIKNQSKFKARSTIFLDMFNDLDSVLGTNDGFLLGKWLSAAKNVTISNNSDEAIHNEFNARNQITLWGPKGEIRDYASKQWSGMIKDYFQMRWKLFINAMSDSLTSRKAFNTTAIAERIFELVEEPFSFRTPYKQYPVVAIGDSVAVCKEMHKKWSKIIK